MGGCLIFTAIVAKSSKPPSYTTAAAGVSEPCCQDSSLACVMRWSYTTPAAAAAGVLSRAARLLALLA